MDKNIKLFYLIIKFSLKKFRMSTWSLEIRYFLSLRFIHMLVPDMLKIYARPSTTKGTQTFALKTRFLAAILIQAFFLARKADELPQR